MMKTKFIVVLAFAILIALNTHVFAGSAYVTPQIGTCFLSDATLSEQGVSDTAEIEFDTGFVLGAAAGYDLGMFRVEGEIGYRMNDIDSFSALGVSISGSGEIDTLSFLVNGLVDFENKTAFTPYVGVGIGIANIEANDVSVGGSNIGSEDDMVFDYQLLVGTTYAINKTMAFDLSYRYFATQDPEFGIDEAEYGSHNILMGLRFGF